MQTLPPEDLPRLFPDRPTGAAEEIRSRLAALRFTQHDDPRLHFEMSVPKALRWRSPAETAGSPGLLVSLVRDSAEINVTVDVVPRELAPAEFAMIRLEERGHALLAKREEDTPIGAMADLLTRREGPDGGVIARTNMAKDGERIFIITCEARAADYPAWAGDFYLALATWKLLHPEHVPLAEPLKAYRYIFPAVIGLSYPASWAVVEEALTERECLVQLLDMRGDRPAGTITVHARSGASPRRLVSDHFKRLSGRAVAPPEAPALEPCPAPELFTAASMQRSICPSPEGELDVRAMVLEAEAGAVLLAVDGPTRARAALDWAIHQRAFEIARDTIYAV